MPLTNEQTTLLSQAMVSQLGKPYLWGAKPDPQNANPPSFDCSGYVHWCFGRLGIVVPYGSEEQFEASVHVAEPSIGDIAFFRADGASVTKHVGMLRDMGTVIEARGEPYNRVITRPRAVWEAWHEFVGWQRFKIIA